MRNEENQKQRRIDFKKLASQTSQLMTPQPATWAYLSNEDYHSCKSSVSSSSVKSLLESHETFLYNFYLRQKEQTPSMRLGTLVHMKILEPEAFDKTVVALPEFEGTPQTKKYQVAKKEFLEQNFGKIAVKKDEFEKVLTISEAILEQEALRNLIENSKKEVSGFFNCPYTGIACRIRPDILLDDTLADIKVTNSIDGEDLSRSIYNYRWDLSLAMYGLGIREIDGKAPKNYILICASNEEPYIVKAHRVSMESLQIGLNDFRYCMQRLKKLITQGLTEPEDFPEISIPHWAKAKVLES